MVGHVYRLRDHLRPQWRHDRARDIPADEVTHAFDAATDAIWNAFVDGRPGAVLVVPPGHWRVDRAVALETPGLTLQGAGVRASTIELVTDDAAHVIVIRSRRVGPEGDRIPPDGITVERLTAVGNRVRHRPKAGGHGIVVRDNAAHLVVRDVVIEDANSNAIGFERTGEARGVFSDLTVRNVTMIRSGRSAIDMKNFDVAQPEANGTRSFLRNLSVDGSSLKWGRDDPQGPQLAFHLRGRRLLGNIDVRSLLGIWFDSGPAGPVNGRGAHFSVLENYYVEVTGDRGLSARAGNARARESRWRLVTDPRDVHDPRILPVAGVRYWTWPAGPPRSLLVDTFVGVGRLGDRAGAGAAAWIEHEGRWELAGAGLGLVAGSGAEPDASPQSDAESLCSVDVGWSDVDVTWTVEQAEAGRIACCFRMASSRELLAVVVDDGQLSLLRRRPDAPDEILDRADRADLGSGTLALRVLCSGTRVEVFLGGATREVLAAERPDLVDSRGTRVGMAASTRARWRRVEVASLPEPRWTGTVVVAEPSATTGAEASGGEVVDPVRSGHPLDGRYRGTFPDPVAQGAFLGDVVKNTVIVTISGGAVASVEFEVKGLASPWLGRFGGPPSTVSGMGGPSARHVVLSGDQISGRVPTQIVQAPPSGLLREGERQGRYRTDLEAEVSDGRMWGRLSAPPEADFHGFALRFVAVRG